MKLFLFLLCSTITWFSIGGCTKPESDCGCVEPPVGDSYFKITSRTGGLTPTSIPLTTDQQNSILTLKQNGQFICTNTQTGMVVNGTLTVTDFASIYGNKGRFVFNPQLPMLNDQYLVLLSVSDGALVFGDNVPDGYTTTFSAIQQP